MDYTIQKDDSDRRFDRVVRKLLPATPLSAIYRAIRKKSILLNGKSPSPKTLVFEGDIITFLDPKLNFCPPGTLRLAARNVAFPQAATAFPALKTLFSNDDFLLINKPYGLATQGGPGVSVSVASIIKGLNPATSSYQSAPLHRLDKTTSGLLVIGRSLEGARTFAQAQRDHLIEKIYFGYVTGKIAGEIIWEDSLDGRATWTQIKSLAARNLSGRQATFVEYRIKTGVKHQIRRVSSAHGFPLLGDERYGGGAPLGERAFILHAARLRVLPGADPRLKRLDGIEAAFSLD